MKRILKLFIKKFSGIISLCILGIAAYVMTGDFSGLVTWVWSFRLIIVPIVLMAICIPFWPTIKGAFGEFLVRRKLSRLNEADYKVLNNVFVKLEEGKTSQIDHLIVSRNGIFVIETKNYSGWISGDEKNEYWTQCFFKYKKRFYNPTWQNYGHVKALRQILKEYEGVQYFPIVVFANTAKIEKVYSDKVIQLRSLYDSIYAHKQTIIGEFDVNTIVIKLKNSSIHDKKEFNNHVENIKHIVEKKSEICPKCGKPLVERVGKYGKFKGCSGFPNCRYIYKGD